MFYEPANGHGLPHDPLKAIVAPRPIGWISTLGPSGRANLAPYSFFNMLAARPPIVFFSSETRKDSAVNAQASGEFVFNLVGRSLAEKMNATSIDAPADIDEFELAGIAKAPSRLVAPPRVADAPAALECRVTEVLVPKGLDGTPTSAVVVLGEVVGVHIGETYLTGGLFDAVKAGNVARLGYMDYSEVTATFAMRRPRWADR